MAAGQAPCLETQKKEIDNLLKLSLKKGDTWYLIDTKWFKQWKKYVGYDSWDTDSVGEERANPGPIDNRNILKENTPVEGQTPKLKEQMIDDIDYILVPEEAWNKLMGWYGLTEGQEPIARKVIQQGVFVRHYKVEVYYLDFKLCENSQPDNQILKQFSRTDTIDHLENEMRRTFNIAENKEVRLWNRYTTNTYEQLTKPDNTLQEAGLYQGQVIVIEVKNDDGTWPRQAKSASSYSSSVSLRSGNSYNNGSSSFDSGYSGGYSYEGRSSRATAEEAIQQIKVIPSQSETAKVPSSISASSIKKAESSVPGALSVTAVGSGTSKISSSDHQFLSSRSGIQPCLISEEQPLSEQLAEELTHAQQMETLSEILIKLESRIVTSRKNIVNVHRENVLDGGFRAFGRKSFDSWCELHVRFSGEAGIDAGGPQREFMCLALKAIKKLPIFSGPDNEKILVYDQKCLTESTYYRAGQMIAYFIIHRGPCPNFMSPALYIALAEGIASIQPTPDEILDDDLREQVKAIADASNEKDFKIAVFKAVDLINLAGCTSLTLQFTPERRNTLVKSLTKFVVCDRILGPFEQFEKGLQTMGLVDEIKKNKEQWREVFIFSTKPLCALQMDSLFTVKWSAEGSKRKYTEERILVYWRDFLQDLEEGEGGMSLTLKDLLAFTTGAEEVPPLGFPFQPKLSFIHPEDLTEEAQLCSAGFPYANTSCMELKIPVLDDYNTFQKNIATAISKAATFKNQ